MSLNQDFRCILSKFYIKPQQAERPQQQQTCCILSKFYIKPQPYWRLYDLSVVVSYRNSTSNHNSCPRTSSYEELYLIEILHQTTTLARRMLAAKRCILSKFYIKPQRVVVEGYSQAVVSYRNSTSNHNQITEIFVQTQLYLIEILHQTTTVSALLNKVGCCILSKFYIKPQRRASY